MNTRPRTKIQTTKAPRIDSDKTKGKVEMQENRQISVPKAVKNRLVNARERKIALWQDVDKLKKKLRHEENVHKALERAFTRPLGTLPRLPPYLPPATLELLAEVAVLEEEVVRLEEQVVHCRQDLYQEAVYIASSKRNVESFADVYDLRPHKNLKPKQSKPCVQNSGPSATSKMKRLPSFSGKRELNNVEDVRGNTNSVSADSVKSSKATSTRKVQSSRIPVKRPPVDIKPSEKNLDPLKLQAECRVRDQENAEPGDQYMANNCPNKISEEIVKCLCSIFIRMSSHQNRSTTDTLSFLMTLVATEDAEKVGRQDPYGISSEFGGIDIGLYKSLHSIDADTINLNRRSNSLFLHHRLTLLIGKLPSVDLQNLNHQEKLAFWINIYNACMMNAYLEYGISDDPETVVALMQKATINVGGHFLNPITIEHFILRLPYHSKYASSRGAKNDETTVRSKFGLELSEPLVTFALSCGSWSSPAVRVYTASEVESELEVAKREYLQAAIGISTTKFVIPKLLDWYLLDFAKDLESLLDWICLQLPNELGKEAIKCLESGESEQHSPFVQVMQYEFSFRYLLCT